MLRHPAPTLTQASDLLDHLIGHVQHGGWARASFHLLPLPPPYLTVTVTLTVTFSLPVVWALTLAHPATKPVTQGRVGIAGAVDFLRLDLRPWLLHRLFRV
jgi:hypothetical protein